MTARDNGRPLSTFRTIVESGLGRATAKYKVPFQCFANTDAVYSLKPKQVMKPKSETKS